MRIKARVHAFNALKSWQKQSSNKKKIFSNDIEDWKELFENKKKEKETVQIS